MASALEALKKRLLDAALAYPDAVLDHPWGEDVVKVAKKVFVFFGVPGGKLHVTCKLPETSEMALTLPFATPTGYGLGKSGWVTATFEAIEDVPEDLLRRWIDESYRAIAPKKLVKMLDAPPEPEKKKKARRSK